MPKKPSRWQPKKVKKLRTDTFYNTTTGIGDSARDKRMGGVPAYWSLSQPDLEAIFRGNDLGAVIAEKLPEEMLRKGFEVKIRDDNETAEAVMAALDTLEVKRHMREALTWSRAFGGGAVLIGANDGSPMSAPINMNRLQSIEYLATLDRWELQAETWYEDPNDLRKFGMPKTYRLIPSGVQGSAIARQVIIHESRLILFDGVPVTRRQRANNQGWGDSVYVRVYEVLRDFNLTWGTAASLMSDWVQGIYKIAGLNELIASGDAEAVVARLQEVDRNRSVLRSVVVDAGNGDDMPAESFTRENAPLAGVPEILTQFAIRLAAAARMPVTMLMGQTPSGLNATGEGDMEWFDDTVAGKQIEVLKPALDRLITVLFACKQGPTKGVEPEYWSLYFCPLYQLDELEEADRRLKIAQADAAYVTAQVLTPEEVAASRFSGDRPDWDRMIVDLDARSKINQMERLKPEPPPQPKAPPKAGGAK